DQGARREARPRRLQDVLLAGSAETIRARAGDATLLLLPGDGQGVHRDPRDRPELRDRVLGYRHQPAPEPTRTAVPRGGPEERPGGARKGRRQRRQDPARATLDPPAEGALQG